MAETFGDGFGRADLGSRLGELRTGAVVDFGKRLGECDVTAAAAACGSLLGSRGDCCGECCTGFAFVFDLADDGIADFSFTFGDAATVVVVWATRCSPSSIAIGDDVITTFSCSTLLELSNLSATLGEAPGVVLYFGSLLFEPVSTVFTLESAFFFLTARSWVGLCEVDCCVADFFAARVRVSIGVSLRSAVV